MIIYFMRHANAGEKRADPIKDEKRPLDKDGVLQCRYVGALLSALDVQVDQVITSPLKRATQTASLVGNEIGFDARLQISDSLRPSATFEDFRALLNACAKHEAIMVVGHNPNLTEFVSQVVTNGGSRKSIELKKGSVARVDFSPKRSVLNWMITPKLARALYGSAHSKSLPKTSRK
ncbi:phosphohistidine phosphatase, SixA [Candidatus Koribacter versatilis Ellin345]|uniref:Phosphohistidine phosphatase, SixA n=1 Tax=Koribacter versatilis (strain Ellin345) TaxID=204669 RepID=Q1ISW3_KORVE|nr:phosphohistidine phosphatase SixA [Candidatus Koribacter versatilis]ABF40037.1 phosphohistidine phosphatase, SixA [Candidatus Koribacter versatilis Ellin345]